MPLALRSQPLMLAGGLGARMVAGCVCVREGGTLYPDARLLPAPVASGTSSGSANPAAPPCPASSCAPDGSGRQTVPGFEGRPRSPPSSGRSRHTARGRGRARRAQRAGAQRGPGRLWRLLCSSRCARLLLSHGANVNCTSEEEEETPLHVAARLGLAALVRLLLRSGADLEAKNVAGQTPLNAACAQPHATDDFYDVCLQLVEAGARVNSADEDRQRPLHQACKNANARVVALLLARGANVNIMSYSGNTALHNILQVAAYKLEHQPEVVVRDLLNHGAVRIWPGALLKVLRHCCASPRTIEALVNCYERVRVTEEWAEAVPGELQQQHARFFQSLFTLGQSPRSLQHLARCTLRSFLDGRLLQALPELHLPAPLHQFVLLRFEDVLY